MLKNLLLSGLTLLLTNTNVSAEEISKEASNNYTIAPFEAHYNVLHKANPVGSGVRKLTYLDNGNAQYSYHTEIEWLIFDDIRSETSIVKLDNFKVTPTHYHYKRTGTGRDKSAQWSYDIPAGTAVNIEQNKTKKIDFPVNIQDKLSYHLQNRLKMIQNPKQDHFVYPVISTSGSIKNYVFQYDGEEEVMLPYGLVSTIRLKREVVEKERVTYAWFAPKLNYLMVKLHQSKGGVEQFEAQLTKVIELDK